MPRLFSYCIPYDDGAAPNPFWGICTLNICKPVIRRNAEPNDWIVATGSSRHGFEKKVVYAMEVTKKLTMKEYYLECLSSYPNKIPDWNSNDMRKKVGDSIYDFSKRTPLVLESVHGLENRKHDLNGKFTLLSTNFYYFGSAPQELPKNLLEILRRGQGHRSTANAPYLKDFIEWIQKYTEAHNQVYAQPFDWQNQEFISFCSSCHKEQDVLDEQSTND
jgi:hypothetical protein